MIQSKLNDTTFNEESDDEVHSCFNYVDAVIDHFEENDKDVTTAINNTGKKSKLRNKQLELKTCQTNSFANATNHNSSTLIRGKT